MARLPVPGSDDGKWGDILNEYLMQSLDASGDLRPGVVTATQLLNGGVTKNKLSIDIQTSLDKADTALQVAPVSTVASRTGDVVLNKADVGLDNVDNTPDLNKPVSSATQTALNTKATDSAVVHLTGNESIAGIKTFTSSPIVPTPTGSTNATSKDYVDTLVASVNIAAGTTGQYFRGDKTWQTLDKSAVGLSNVDNISETTRNAQAATLTNKTIDGSTNTLQNIAQSSVTGLVTSLSAKATDSAVVHLTGDESIAGTKTFSSSPVVPEPSVTSHATSKNYVDTVVATKQAVVASPAGYILVPGNSQFGTSDFYVMKYQAKNDGSNNAVSVAAGTPWVNISQRDAMDKSRAIGSKYHLLTEAEWMTIATNILFVDSNWTGGAVGSGQLYQGHTDNNPSNALAASSDDGQGYFGTGNSATDAVGSGREQRRTFTLSNGEVIWDIAGNVWEWTCAWINQNEQPSVASITDGSANWRQYTAINQYKGYAYLNPTNRGWTSSQGLGQIYSYSNSTSTSQYGFLRGGVYNAGTLAGIFALNLSLGPTGAVSDAGFRAARSVVA